MQIGDLFETHEKNEYIGSLNKIMTIIFLSFGRITHPSIKYCTTNIYRDYIQLNFTSNTSNIEFVNAKL